MKNDQIRTFSRTWAIALLVLVIASSLPLNTEAASQRASGKARHVIVISLDGLDVRYLQKRDEYGLKIPTLRRLMDEGVMAQVVGVYPSVTYPSHTSIVTGTTPRPHGIYNNEIFEPPDTPQTGKWYWFAKDIRVDTLWAAATRARFSTALISWPVSVGAGDHNFPEIFKIGGTREESLVVIKANARPAGFVEEVERSDPQVYSKGTKDEGDDMRTRFAEYVIAEKKPGVVLIHLFNLDHFEHDFGPFSPEAFATLEKADNYVARILAAAARAGTLSDTAVFIVSDHGFLPVAKRIHPGVVLARAGLIDLRKDKDSQGRDRVTVTGWRAAPYVSAGSCSIMLRDPKDRDAYKRTLAALQDFEKNEGRGSFRLLAVNEVKRDAADPNAAFVLEALEGHYFSAGYTGEAITQAKLKGQHGFLPSRYFTSFIAAGAGVRRRGSLGTIRLIDEGPTIARVLGFKLRDAEGRAIGLK